MELDVKQEFQFDGIQALLDFEIDLLITPDPVKTKNLSFTPLFEYEHVLAVPQNHPLALRDHILAEDLLEQVLITYPVPLERLDIFTRCLIPAQCRPQQHKTIETTDIMLQMVASGRGITALPRWLVEDSQKRFGLKAVSHRSRRHLERDQCGNPGSGTVQPIIFKDLSTLPDSKNP